MFVYALKCKLNGKCYVGQTSLPLKKRLSEHRRLARTAHARGKSVIHHAIAKYGWDGFEVEVLDRPTSPELLDLSETFWIKTLNSVVPSGYNLDSGGHALKRLSPQTRAKISAKKIGKKHSTETRLRMIKAASGRRLTTSHRSRIAAALKGNPACQKFSDDQIRAVREAYCQIKSFAAVARAHNVSPTHVRNIVRGRRRA